MRTPGVYADGNGLYLHVRATGAKSWLFRYSSNGKRREMGLGALRDTPLAEARERAMEARRKLLRGTDPLDARNASRVSKQAAAANSVTLESAAQNYIHMHRSRWRSSKHERQWETTFQTYVFPIAGHLSVAAVDTDVVLKILQPIWDEKLETAARLRGRIESVLDWAAAKGFREAGPNPAVWKGNLAHLLPKRAKTEQARHAALPYARCPEFYAALLQRDTVASLAIRFLIATAARSGEVRGATWAEIDIAAKLWVVPGARMKAGKEHAVPLSTAALDALKPLRARWRAGTGEEPYAGHLIFPGTGGRPLSDVTLTRTMARIGFESTIHGLRSSFRDWCGDRTSFPREVAEAALAHATGNAVEAAYRRGTAIERRRELMQAWAAFLEPGAAESANERENQ